MKRKAILTSFIVLLGLLTVFAAGCGENTDNQQVVQSENKDGNYKKGEDNADITVPADLNVYTVKGVIVGDATSITRQIEPASGSVGGFMGGGYGFVSGSYTGPEYGGKGFVRLYVLESDTHRADGADLAPVGSLIILKTTDQKVVALHPWYIATFKCRRDYEPIAAEGKNETFDAEKVGTWELDWARLETPVMQKADKALIEQIGWS